MAALLLADRVVTLMPGIHAADGSPRGAHAVRQSPRYVAFMDSWRWSMPLWKSGVIVSDVGGDRGGPDVRAACDRVEAHAELAPLRVFMKPGFAQDHVRFLDAAARDVLKGGPDPAFSVPMAAGLDRFACRHGLIVARADATSLSQKAEAALAVPIASVAVPFLSQAGGESLTRARDTLAAPLAALRRAVDAAAESDRPAPRSALAPAAADYARAFDASLPDLSSAGDADDIRLVPALAMLSFVRLPCDAALRSSAAAARTIVRTVAPEVASRAPVGAPERAPVLAEPLDSGRVLAMVVKVVGARKAH